MHNLHFVRIKSDNIKEACETVQTEIEDWGTENNWKTICGAVSKNGDSFNCGEGRWEPNLNDVKDMMNDIYSKTDKHYQKAIDMLISNKKISAHEWWCIQQYAEDQYQKEICTANGKFNIWKDSYFSHQYDKSGLTAMDWFEGGNQYIVFVDMHS